MDSGGATLGVIGDQFGHGVGTVSSGTVTWSSTQVSGYGPIPGTTIDGLTDITHVAAATAWRSRRVDPTDFIYLGARYYEPSSGRFLSTDPMGHGASMSLYDFANGDPANHFDPNGRFGKLTSRIGPDGLRFLDDQIYQCPNSRQRSLADESIFQGAGTAALHGAEAYAVGLMQGGWGAVTGAVHSVLHPGDTVTNTLAAIVELDERLHYDPIGLASDVGHAIEATLTDPQRLGQAVGAAVVSTALGELGGTLTREGAAAETIDPAVVRFSQDSIGSTFKSGGTIDDLARALRGPGGEELALRIPPIRLVEQDGLLYTLDNRRLAAFSGSGQQVPFRMATYREIAKEWVKKFTTTAEQGSGQYITVRPGR